MKKPLILLMLLNISLCYGQQSPGAKELKERTLRALSQIKSFCLLKRPDGKDTLVQYIQLNPQDQISQKHYPDPAEAIKKYGTKSVIIITLKPGIVLLNFEKELSKYDIPPNERHLPVRIDNYVIWKKAHEVTITPNVVKTAKISRDSITNEKFIDVRTGRRLRPYKEKIVI